MYQARRGLKYTLGRGRRVYSRARDSLAIWFRDARVVLMEFISGGVDRFVGSEVQHQVFGQGSRAVLLALGAPAPFSEFLSIQRRLDGVEQCIWAERLAQEIHGTSGDSLCPVFLVRTGGDKNDRNAFVGVRQISLQFQAIHSWHSKVED
jgi:hypothetical protein